MKNTKTDWIERFEDKFPLFAPVRGTPLAKFIQKEIQDALAAQKEGGVKKDLEKQIKELTRRVEELEKRPQTFSPAFSPSPYCPSPSCSHCGMFDPPLGHYHIV